MPAKDSGILTLKRMMMMMMKIQEKEMKMMR
jgi:hypothetical protein